MFGSYVIKMKAAVATLPPTLPTLLLYTSTLVAPVARMDVTRIISANAAMLAPRITNASCTGSTLSTYKVKTVWKTFYNKFKFSFLLTKVV